MLRERLRATPFRPFKISLMDGRELEVSKPENLTLTARGRLVWEGVADDEFAMSMQSQVVGVERR